MIGDRSRETRRTPTGFSGAARIALAAAALAASGAYRAELDYYRPIPEWIAGFALMHAAPAHP